METILLAISLGLNQKHFFGKAVGSVCFFRITHPDIFFFERNGREFRIGTDGGDSHEFLRPGFSGRLLHLNPHHQIVVKKLARFFAVKSDAADLGGQMNYNIALLRDLLANRALSQVEITRARRKNISCRHSPLFKLPNDTTAQKPGPSGHNEFFIAKFPSTRPPAICHAPYYIIRGIIFQPV